MVGREAAKLILQNRKVDADVRNLPLFVESAHGLGAGHLSAAGMNSAIGHVRVDHPDRALDHLPALIDLRDEPIGVMTAIGVDGNFSPFMRCIFARKIFKNVSTALC